MMIELRNCWTDSLTERTFVTPTIPTLVGGGEGGGAIGEEERSFGDQATGVVSGDVTIDESSVDT